MGQVSLSGSLIHGPATLGTPGVPNGQVQFAFATTPDPKLTNADVKGYKRINSPSSFYTMPGIGTTSDVTTADFLYFRTDSPVTVRITQQGQGVQLVQVQGLLVIEFSTTAYMTLLEVQGTANVEYFASGPA